MKKSIKNQKKTIKTLRTVLIVLATIFTIELIIFGVKLYLARVNSEYYTLWSSIVKGDNTLVAVGLSDFKNSKFNKYEKPGFNKPTIWEMDENLKLIKEEKYSEGYNGTFNDVIKVKDGYVAVGQIEINKKMHDEKLNEGLIVKYDNNLKIVWQNTLQILDNTNIYKVKIDKNDNIVVVGSSVYANDIIGNHTTGGAIIVVYNKDGEKLKTINYGGPKTGLFNDLIILDDAYVAVGLTDTNTGIILKYDKKGKEIWHNYYGYTDSKGLLSINYDYSDKTFIVTTSKLKEKTNTDNYEGVILKLNSNGKIIKEQHFKEDNISRIEKSLILDDKIIAIAIYGKKENNTLKNSSAILEYNKNLELTKKELLKNDKTTTFTNILKLDNDYLVVGHTNSKIKQLKTNGYDYYPFVIKYNQDLKKIAFN